MTSKTAKSVTTIDALVPEVIPIPLEDEDRAHLVRATGDTFRAGKAWAATYRAANSGALTWRCDHLHRSIAGALACATRAAAGLDVEVTGPASTEPEGNGER
jgi:hypothetical protein